VLSMLAMLLVSDRQSVSRLRQGAMAALGMAGTFAAAAIALATQGSLGAYIETIAYNTHYASARIESDSPVTRIRVHLSVVSHYFTTAGRWQAPAAIAALAVFAALAAVALRRGDRTLRVLVLLAAGTLGAGMISLALTAYYAHHLQLLALPAALIAVSFVTAASTWLGGRAALVLGAACVLFALWSAGKGDWPPSVSQWSDEPVSVGARELESARTRYFASGDDVDYVVLGSKAAGARPRLVRLLQRVPRGYGVAGVRHGRSGAARGRLHARQRDPLGLPGVAAHGLGRELSGDAGSFRALWTRVDFRGTAHGSREPPHGARRRS